MLDTLRRIVQNVNAAPHLMDVLTIIVRQVKQAIAVDVCSVYLKDTEEPGYVLMATDGLNPSAVGNVRLGLDEGLIGIVGNRAEPVNLDDAPIHPRYCFIHDTGEEQFHGFLGVPIIQHRRTLGVLVVRQKRKRRFSENEVSFLVTLAAQLSGAISHAEARGGIGLPNAFIHTETHILDGVPGSPGVGIGRVSIAYPQAKLEAVPDRKVTDVEAEEATFCEAIRAIQKEMQTLSQRMGHVLPPSEQALFDAYVMMLRSDSLIDGTIQRIRGGAWAPAALRETIAEHARVFEAMEDPYLRQRAEDIRDIGQRILIRLQSETAQSVDYPSGTLLVGEEITAVQLAEVSPKRLAGVVSASGSGSSHVAILTRALGIPSVMGVSDLPVGQLEGQELIVDGYQGRVFIKPSPALRKEFQRIVREEAKLSVGLAGLRNLPAQTPDGVQMPLYVNAGLLTDITPSQDSGADGIGLYRTEMPFMVRDRFPGEAEQQLLYRKILASFSPRPVFLRTLDVGGDKPLPYFPIHEDNPFLGWRGIRITLDHPEIFIGQLRAMLGASVYLNNLHLLLPMISGVPELDEALALVRQAYTELLEEEVPVEMPRLGAMIEVPSAIYQTSALARRVDFFSVGTNDLTQYLLAVDRNNARVAGLYDSLHPAVLAALAQVVEYAHQEGRPISVCGEMAGDPAAAILLLGMGFDSLSMSVGSLPRVKWVIRSFRQDTARELVKQALSLENAASIRALLNSALEQAGLGGLVRAGK
jgi:phosphotransferase system enzyme I (PtsP)